ncbi:LOW QUALITY PROTEIN: hypothetical protein TorRG33x02_241070 [Trema orientale]|uniref:Uncharacterized protein n=1 Tax=Trema orientale TaxID=63057 RepID=A0A2P5DV15_TREOI|nr:LOW QUALITY PROTEIN: hypothetical protein TorRG33x02_241070 [Trema orientale]
MPIPHCIILPKMEKIRPRISCSIFIQQSSLKQNQALDIVNVCHSNVWHLQKLVNTSVNCRPFN